jgi:hypothetical protein
MRRLALPGYGLGGPALSHVTKRPRVVTRLMAIEDHGGSQAALSAPYRHAEGAGARQQARVQA